MRASMLLLLIGLCGCVSPAALGGTPPVQDGDFTIRDFHFASGAVLPELRLHYATLGRPSRDARGRITNAVLLLHGTGGDGGQFLRPQFADELFGPGQPLDASRYYVILPDGIGHGRSSKPSDGLRAKFPAYNYADMVEAQHRLVSEHLGIERLRLILGTSMGCMHAFVWGETFPHSMDALMPLACLPVAIAGRNRMWRRMVIDAIREDPDWDGGNYAAEPRRALRTAADLLLIAGSAPLYFQAAFPTRESADAFVTERTEQTIGGLDANDLLYQVSASRDYDPAPRLGTIEAPVLWINSADDFINPPELGIAEARVRELRHGRFVLLPASEHTHGHGSHTWAALWKSELESLLATTAPAVR
ncbi:MAG: alpha/beta fold hydrolase [Proteobacteria bacterium]|nr:alpha/beta fold hydrolase [Pseudomonadota bacterium]